MVGSRWVAGVVSLIGLVFVPSNAHGAERAEVEIAILGGFGHGGSVDDSSVNRYGPGLGARAGVTLKAPRLYLGGSFVRFLGNEEGGSEYYTATLDALIGYDFRLLREHLLLRPEIGLGVAQAVTIQPDNVGYPLTPHFAPGLLAGLRLSPLLVFAEVRGDLSLDWANSVTGLIGAGVIF
jgi:hypothetical protein